MATANSGFVLDSSAIIAAIADEPRADEVRALLRQASRIYVSAATLLEVRMVLAGRQMTVGLDTWLETLNPQVLSFTEEHVVAASDAFLRFGKGLHPARLNFGDCMAYATAKLSRLPLLFVGDDFDQTDLECVKV